MTYILSGASDEMFICNAMFIEKKIVKAKHFS